MSAPRLQRPLVPAAALPDRLISGYRAFLAERLPQEKSRFETLAAEGQQPDIMLIGCCDSRVAPEVIFDANPGELFVVRNVANLVPPYSPDEGLHGVSAALEFAVQALRVKHIVVLGHGRCGGIRAFASNDTEPLSPGDFIGKWIKLVEPAATGAGQRRARESLEDYIERLALISIENSIANLLTFPCVRILHERGQLQVHGAYFDVFSGVLLMRDPTSGRFVPAVEGISERVSAMGCR
jgi:carbonic anhydrase